MNNDTGVELHLGDCVEIMRGLADKSVDAVITDPPYAEVDRSYGCLTESEWWDLMMKVCQQTRRILKPTGSAMFIIQPNSKRVGQMRGWVFEFMAWVCREWNMVQDAYWWNIAAIPTCHTSFGLMRGSLKMCVWCGEPDCYRNQDAVLWSESFGNAQQRLSARAIRESFPSGHGVNRLRCTQSAIRRGGVTPFNVLPMSNGGSQSSAGAYGHGAGTPLELAKWWTRYICPPGGTVLDPFMGSGTMGLAALEYGNSFIGIEINEQYFKIAQRRIAEAQAQLAMPL